MEVDLEYPTPRALRQRIELLEDPILGELYHNQMEDYRWWGHESKYSKFREYFQLIRQQEIHQTYLRSPLDEFYSVADQAGQKDEFTVLPYLDKDANLYTAYPPGVMPPDYSHADSPDIVVPTEEQMKAREIQEAEKHTRAYLDLWDIADKVQEEYNEASYKEFDAAHRPYQLGEAIVPDVETKIKIPLDFRQAPPSSVYASFDQLAVDDIFAKKSPIGDLNALELGTSPVKEKHLAPSITTRFTAAPAAWGEQVALTQAYERALYAHHIASLLAVEQNLPKPSVPLPDSRLSPSSLLDARQRFATRLATVEYLVSEAPSDADPLARLKRQATIAAHVLAGQESGFLPTDNEKLPQVFQDSLQQLRHYSFILDRAHKFEVRQQGIEKTLQIRQELLTNPEQPQDMIVHWTGSDNTYARVPHRPESWELVESDLETQAASQVLATSSHPPLAEISSNSTNTANNLPTASPTDIQQDSTSRITASKYMTSNSFDWQAFNNDIYREGMPPEEFNLACEAMLQAIDLHFQRYSHGLQHELLSDENREILMRSSTEIAHMRSETIGAKMREYDLGHPFPALPKKVTQDSYQLYQENVKRHIVEREAEVMKLHQQYPATQFEFVAAPASAIPEMDSKEAPLMWSEAIMERLDEQKGHYHDALSELLIKDARGQVTLDELTAFAEKYHAHIGVAGLEGKQTIINKFVQDFLPLNCMSMEEQALRYSRMAVIDGFVNVADRNMRIARTKRILEEIDAYWHQKAQPNYVEVPKTTAELELARREEKWATRDAYEEYVASRTDQEMQQIEDSLLFQREQIAQTQNVMLALRDLNIIQTDLELRHLSEGLPPGTAPVHRQLPRWAIGPMRVVSAIQQFIIRPPFIWARKLGMFLGKFYPSSWITLTAIRLSGLERFPNLALLQADPVVSHMYHPYYRDRMFRLLNMFAPSTLTAKERALSTEKYVPSWSEWRFNEFKVRWMDRFAWATRGYRLWAVPAICITAFITYAQLERRKTWAHDLIRQHPEGLDMAAIERRRWIQRIQLQIPSIFNPNIGPTGIWFGYNATPAEYQNAPYLHRASSTNASDYKNIE